MGLFKTKTKTMQTAVQWLVEQLEERGHIIPDHIEETSLIKEKQQMIDALEYGWDNGHIHISILEDVEEKYYNDTYGSKGSDEIKQ